MRQTNQIRNKKGTCLVESLLGITLFIWLFAMLLAASFLGCAIETNSRLCRDAARQAARVCPQTSDTNGPLATANPIRQAAQSQIQNDLNLGPNPWCSAVKLESVELSGLKPTSYTIVAGPIFGYVTVKTVATIELPLPCAQALPNSISIRSSQCCPITATPSLP